MDVVALHRNSKQKWLNWCLAVILAFAGMIVATAPSANAASYVSATKGYGKYFPAGSGRTYGGHVGEWVIPGKFTGFCTEMNKGLANTDIVGDISTLPGASSTTDKRRAMEIANSYFRKGQRSNTNAYRTSFAIWYLLDPKGKSYYNDMVSRGRLTSSDVKAIKALWSESTRIVGGFNVKPSTPAVEVGGSATGTAKVTNKLNGYYAPVGLPVTVITSSNNKVTSVSGTTGNKGKISTLGYTKWKYTRTNVGTVRTDVYVYAPSSVKTRSTFPSSSTRQRLIGSKYYETSRGYTTFEKKAGGSSYTTTCATNCDGTNIPVTVKVCQAANSKSVKHAYTNVSTGQVVGYVEAASGDCATKTLRLNDSVKLSDKYCYTSSVGGSCVTGWTAVPGTYTVVCPAWAKAVVEAGSGCDWCTAGVRFTTPAHPQFGSRWYVGSIYVGNSAGDLLNRRVNLTNGQMEYFDLTDKVQVGSTITAKFVVYKDEARTQVLQGEKLLWKVQILELGNSSMKVQQTVTTADGKTSSSIKTLAR